MIPNPPTAATILQACRLVGILIAGSYTYGRVWDQAPPDEVPDQYLPLAACVDAGAEIIYTSDNFAELRRVRLALRSKEQDRAEALVQLWANALITSNNPSISPPQTPPFFITGSSLTFSKMEGKSVVNLSRMDVEVGKMVKEASVTMRIRITTP